MNKVNMCVFVALVAAQAASADVIYSNIPSTLPDNYPSLGYQATSTQEFGDRINFAGTARDLQTVTATMSSWAKQEDYDPTDTVTSYTKDITMNIYNAGTGATPGSLIASVTQTFVIPYRPTGWSANGIAFNINFDFSSLNVTLPDSVVFGLAFDTQTHGYNPTGVSGPSDSLNFALNDGPGGGITTGSNDNLDDTFWNTSYGPFYADGGAGGVNTFRQDTGWTGYTPMVEFNAIPAPSSLALIGFGGLFASRRRRA